MAKKVRVLYTIPNFDTAGSGLLLYHILSKLDRDRFHPEVSVLRITNTITENRIRQLGVDIYQSNFDIPIRPYRSLIFRAMRSATAFRKRKYDIWHSFHYSDSYTEPLISRFAGRVKWVYTKKAMGWGSRAWKLKSVLADAIVADNTDMLKEFFSGWPLQRKVHFIPHSVDPEVYRPKERPTSQEGRDARNIVLCVVAHLVPVKGHPTLLEALRGCPNTTLLIAGRTNDTGYYREPLITPFYALCRARN
jgi:glycosyltransferase involved in cell wall biosynthesis